MNKRFANFNKQISFWFSKIDSEGWQILILGGLIIGIVISLITFSVFWDYPKHRIPDGAVVERKIDNNWSIIQYNGSRMLVYGTWSQMSITFLPGSSTITHDPNVYSIPNSVRDDFCKRGILPIDEVLERIPIGVFRVLCNSNK